MDTNYTGPALSSAAGSAKWTQGDVFFDVRTDLYWSGTEFDADSTRTVDMHAGGTAEAIKLYSSIYA